MACSYCRLRKRLNVAKSLPGWRRHGTDEAREILLMKWSLSNFLTPKSLCTVMMCLRFIVTTLSTSIDLHDGCNSRMCIRYIVTTLPTSIDFRMMDTIPSPQPDTVLDMFDIYGSRLRHETVYLLKWKLSESWRLERERSETSSKPKRLIGFHWEQETKVWIGLVSRPVQAWKWYMKRILSWA